MKKILALMILLFFGYTVQAQKRPKDTTHIPIRAITTVITDTGHVPVQVVTNYDPQQKNDTNKTKIKTNYDPYSKIDTNKMKGKTDYIPPTDLKAPLTPLCVGMVDKNGNIISHAGINFDVYVDEKSAYTIRFEGQSFNIKDYALFVTMINASTPGLTPYVSYVRNNDGTGDAVIHIEAPLPEGADYYSRKYASVAFSFVLYKFRRP